MSSSASTALSLMLPVAATANQPLVDPLVEELKTHLTKTRILDNSIADQMVKIFNENVNRVFKAVLPKPDLRILGYKVMAFDKDNTVELYLYKIRMPSAVFDGTSSNLLLTDFSIGDDQAISQDVQNGAQKHLHNAIRVVISKKDKQIVTFQTVDKIARLTINLNGEPGYTDKVEVFRHEAALNESVFGNEKFTQLYAWSIYNGKRGGSPCLKGVMFQKFCPKGTFEKLEVSALDTSPNATDRFTQYRHQLGSILEALVELCKKKIIHSDFHSANILFDENFNAVIGDLEFAITTDEAKDPAVIEKYLLRGVCILQPPEKVLNYLNKVGHTQAHINSNVWFIGCLFYHFLYGIMPDAVSYFEQYRNTQKHISIKKSIKESTLQRLQTDLLKKYETMAKIAESRFENPEIVHPDIDDMMEMMKVSVSAKPSAADNPTKKPLKDRPSIDYLIDMMLHPDPDKRITADKALEYFKTI